MLIVFIPPWAFLVQSARPVRALKGERGNERVFVVSRRLILQLLDMKGVASRSKIGLTGSTEQL